MKKEYEEIIEDLQRTIIKEWTDEEKDEFYLTGIKNDESLTMYHHSLGRYIRNKYSLWSIPWEPDLRNGIDYSPFHPDEVSSIIIKELWKRGVPE